MKRLHDLKKSLPSNARLNIFEKTRVKGGSDAGGSEEDKRDRTDRPSENKNKFGG